MTIIYYRRFMTDYITDTAHLSFVEHGAYTRLLDLYYVNEGPLPAADIVRTSGARTPEEVAAVEYILGRYFQLVDGRFCNGRADDEIAHVKSVSSAASSNGRRGGRPRKTGPKADEKRALNGRFTDAKQPLNGGFAGDNPAQSGRKADEKRTESKQKAIPDSRSKIPVGAVETATGGESGEPPEESINRAIYADARRLMGPSAGGMVSKQLGVNGRGQAWVVEILGEIDRRKMDPEAARAYYAKASAPKIREVVC